MYIGNLYSRGTPLLTNWYNVCPTPAGLYQRMQDCVSRAFDFLFDTALIIPVFFATYGLFFGFLMDLVAMDFSFTLTILLGSCFGGVVLVFWAAVKISIFVRHLFNAYQARKWEERQTNYVESILIPCIFLICLHKKVIKIIRKQQDHIRELIKDSSIPSDKRKELEDFLAVCYDELKITKAMKALIKDFKNKPVVQHVKHHYLRANFSTRGLKHFKKALPFLSQDKQEEWVSKRDWPFLQGMQDNYKSLGSQLKNNSKRYRSFCINILRIRDYFINPDQISQMKSLLGETYSKAKTW